MSDDNLKHGEISGDEDNSEGGEPMDIDEARKNLGLTSENNEELDGEKDFKDEHLVDDDSDKAS